MIIRHFIRKYRATLAATSFLAAAGATMTLVLLARINDLASSALITQNLTLLFSGSSWLVALLITNGLSQALLAHLGGDLVAKLRADLSLRFIAVEYEKLASQKHAVFGSLIEDIARIGPLVLLAPNLVYNGLLAALCTVYLITLSAPLSGILLACMTVSGGVSWILVRATHTQFKEMRRSEETVFECFRSISEGKKEMSMNSRRAEHFVETLLHPAIERSRTWMVKAYLRWGLNQAWSSTTLYASIFFSVYLGHSLLTLSPQIVVHSVIGALFLVGPLSFLVNAGLQVGLGKASLRHLEKVGVDLQSEINLTDATKRETAHRGEAWRHIHASQVVYQYPSETDSKHIIGPLNLSISRGEMLFLSGGNGSGKSTLLLLLCSLLAPTGGQVFIDGRPVQDELISYRSRFAGVFGDFFLFSHVIDAAGNLTPDHQVEALLKQLHLSTQVEVKQGKLSRLTLSTGQRKRLALLQCYAEDREICFFDEWAADQDQHFREYFYCVLLPELKSRGKTVLVISHDDRYFHLADRVIKLEGGLIVSGDAPIPEVPLWNASTANI